MTVISSGHMGRRRTTNLYLPPRMRFQHGAYYYRPRVDGKQLCIRLSSDYGEALAKWAELEGSQQDGSTVGHLIDRYLIEVLPSLAEKTQAERRRQAGTLREVFGSMPLEAVRPHHVASYLDKRTAKVAGNREITFLSSMYQYAMRWGWCESNPCTGIRRNTEKKRTRYITDAELDLLRSAASDQLACMIDLSYLTAIRKGDLLKLRLSAITRDGIEVRQGKTGHAQVFTWTDDLRAVVTRAKGLRRRASSMYLFATRNGAPMTASGFNSLWRRARDKAGIEDCHWHDLRAKALTDAHRAQGSDYAQALAGHASVTMTESYVKSRQVNKVQPLK